MLSLRDLRGVIVSFVIVHSLFVGRSGLKLVDISDETILINSLKVIG